MRSMKSFPLAAAILRVELNVGNQIRRVGSRIERRGHTLRQACFVAGESRQPGLVGRHGLIYEIGLVRQFVDHRRCKGMDYGSDNAVRVDIVSALQHGPLGAGAGEVEKLG